jgi:uncharacterized protein YecT (DUF1311 family)
MPLIDLSTLDGAELRSLLDSARRHGQAAQSYEILREMEARRHRGPRPKTVLPKRNKREPRTISLELGDPLDRRDEPLPDEPLLDERLSAAPAEELPPITLADPPPARRKPSREPPPPPAPKRRGWAHWGALIFALGLAGGVAGGWWAANFANGGPPQAAALPPPTPSAVQTAALPPAAPAVNAEAPVTLVPDAGQVPPPPPPPTAADGAQPALTPTPPAQPAMAPAATPAPAAPIAQAKPADVVPTATVEPAADEAACSAKTTPADRTICADPKLRSLQAELRKAYAAALDAHEDKATLRQRELAWADARNAVTDPAELATLYKQRIEKLRAATADALAKR